MVDIDREIANTDWPKRTWDLEVETLDDLFRYLAGPGEPVEVGHRRLTDFLFLPVAQAMPPELAEEVKKFCDENRGKVEKHGDPGDPGYRLLHPNSKARSYFRTIQRGTGGPQTPTSKPSGRAPAPAPKPKAKTKYGRPLLGPESAPAKAPAKKVTTKKPAAKKTVARRAVPPKPPAKKVVTAPRKKVVPSGTGTPAKGTKIYRPKMHPATPDDYAWMKSLGVPIPPAWTDVMVVDDRKNEKHLLAKGRDAAGRRQPKMHPEHTKEASGIKFGRTARLRKVLPDLDKVLDRDAMKLDTAAVIKLIRLTGIRPGSDKDTQAKEKAYGATTLEARHITINQNSVTFDFIGKKGVPIHLLNKDPEVFNLMRHWKGTKQRNERLFTSSRGSYNIYLKRAIPGDFLIKDLRTNIGTNAAWAERKKSAYKKPPTSMTELNKRKKSISVEVSRVLGNKPNEALKSYIDPEVWADWSVLFGENL